MIKKPISLRRANNDDCRQLFEWRNNASTRQASISTAPLTYEDHQKWHEKALRDPHRLILIGQYEDDDIGMVRLDRLPDENCVEISIIMAPEARGQKLASPLLAAALRKNPFPEDCLMATVKPSNTASLRIFERNGFEFWRENCLMKGRYIATGEPL